MTQSRERNLPVPLMKDLKMGSWKHVEVDGRPTIEASVRSRFESPFAARVRIPLVSLEEHGADVLIVQAITWETVREFRLQPRHSLLLSRRNLAAAASLMIKGVECIGYHAVRVRG